MIGRVIQQRHLVGSAETLKLRCCHFGKLIDGLLLRPVRRDYNGDFNNRRNVNAGNRPDNRLEMVFSCTMGNCDLMETYKTLYNKVYSYQNIELAYKKARKRKTTKSYVIEFEKNLQVNLEQLSQELRDFTYSPNPLTTFIVRDPKTRRINASDFRDRIVHHALCNIISPIFEKCFIHDSFANRKNKGTHKAIIRAERFVKRFIVHRAVRRGGANSKTVCKGYALKADIRHYFDTIDHEILMGIISRKIKDENMIRLIKMILNNHRTKANGKGMPLGNLTSQFFANVYLNELDQYLKNEVKVENYIRYVDDFVVFHKDRYTLGTWKLMIADFLKSELKLELHPEKSRIVLLKNGITMLGFRIFPGNRLLKKSNTRRIWKRMNKFKEGYERNEISEEDIMKSINGWITYARFANTYHLRKRVFLKYKEITKPKKTTVVNSWRVLSALSCPLCSTSPLYGP